MSAEQITPGFLTSKIIKDLQTLAIIGMPNEVCGVIHRHSIIHQYPNTFYGNHTHGFDMEVDIHDDTLLALWHSHPGGMREPSMDDLPCMEELARHGYDYPWLIVTGKEVTAWKFTTVELGSSLIT